MISIVIPTYNRTALLMERALPSVLAQTYADLDIHVVGDGTEQATVDAMAGVTDPRVRFTNLPRSTYPDDPQARWCVMGIPAYNHGLSEARGAWVGLLADDDAYMPDHCERLLDAATEQGVDVVYGRTEVVGHGLLGSYPPRPSGFTDGAIMWRTALGYRYDPECASRGLPSDWDLWSRMLADGVRFGFTSAVVYRYWPAHKVPVVDAA